MSNYPPEVETMEPPFEPSRIFEHDERDFANGHRIIFGADHKWSIVGEAYGSKPVGEFKTLTEAREALALGLICDECGADFNEESRIITDPDLENREVAGKWCHPDCMCDAFNREAERLARVGV